MTDTTEDRPDWQETDTYVVFSDAPTPPVLGRDGGEAVGTR